jgi:histidyl-tRNA synthetase
MSSALKKKKKEEVTPEAFFDRIEEIKRRKETFFTYISYEEQEEKIPKLQKLFEELRPLIREAVHKAKSDAKTKAETLYSFGKFAAMYDYLMTLHKLTFDLSLVYSEDFYKKIVELTERAIEIFSKIKQGEPLENVMNELDFLYFNTKQYVDEFIKSFEDYVEDLQGSVCGP